MCLRWRLLDGFVDRRSAQVFYIGRAPRPAIGRWSPQIVPESGGLFRGDLVRLEHSGVALQGFVVVVLAGELCQKGVVHLDSFMGGEGLDNLLGWERREQTCCVLRKGPLSVGVGHALFDVVETSADAGHHIKRFRGGEVCEFGVEVLDDIDDCRHSFDLSPYIVGRQPCTAQTNLRSLLVSRGPCGVVLSV